MKIRRGPDGIHLFDRKKGNNILIDEIIPNVDTWTNSPRQVSIALTNACDLFCSHCYAPKQIAELDTSTVKRWMAELDDCGCFGIGFGGGEPTLHPGLVDICRFGQSHTNLAISMTTHGHNLDDTLLKQLAGNLNFVRVSMDGIGGTYESIRGRSFDNLMIHLQKLKHVFPFGINYVVNNRTIDDLVDATKIAEEVGASELLLLPEVGAGNGTSIDASTLALLKSWVPSYTGPLRMSISSSHADGFPTALVLDKEEQALGFAHIDAEGTFKRTSFDKSGLKINDNGVMSTFRELNKQSLGEYV
jgi:sulfatase maturation enzyme AslB (radical SAM superfamily)